MTHFAIITRLAPSGLAAREAATPEHRRYLAAHADRLLAVGPTLADDGITPIGSVYLIEAEDRSAAERFVAEDPMTLAGARESVEIMVWRLAGFDRRYPLTTGGNAR